MQNILNRHKSIIFLNGTPPDKALLAHINTQTPIIAADGAAAKLRSLGLIPTYVVGDGDSLNKSIDLPETTIIDSTDQDSTDFEKCILLVQQQQLLPALILGISGGEIDHVLGNMQALIKHAQDQSLYFLDTYKKATDNQLGVKIGIPISRNPLTLTIEPNSLVSIIPFYNTTVTTTGLQWELDNTALTTDSILGVRNMSKKNLITFNVHKGKSLIIIELSTHCFHF